MENIVNKVKRYIQNGDYYSEFEAVKGGIRNKCLKYTDEKKNSYFIKLYNKNVLYSKHISLSRCESEYAICKYLRENGARVCMPLFCDKDSQINIFEFYKGNNLYDYKKLDLYIINKIIKEIVNLHKIEVKKNIYGCIFNSLDYEDLIRYLYDGFTFLATLYGKSNYEFDVSLCQNVSKYIIQEKQVWGNIQMHNGNILVDDGNVIFCDFEKAHPHFPQMDLISFLHARNFSMNTDKVIIDKYLELNKEIIDKGKFLDIFDLLFVIDNLRALKKIYLNNKGLALKWIEENGVRKKIEIVDKEGIGIRWNSERNESIDKRISNIFEKKYANNILSYRLRDTVKSIVY